MKNMFKSSGKNSLAQGHVEVMISFALFIGFLIFIFIFLNPFSKTNQTSFNINSIQKVILENISDDINYLSVIVKNPGDCYELNSPAPDINLTEVIDSANPRKYTIYFSKDLNGNTPHNILSCARNYTIGAYSKEKMIVYEKVVDFKARYKTDYSSLKKDLGLNNDFSLNFKDRNGNENPDLSFSTKTPAGVEREAKEFPVIVIDHAGKIYEYVLNIRVW